MNSEYSYAIDLRSQGTGITISSAVAAFYELSGDHFGRASEFWVTDKQFQILRADAEKNYQMASEPRCTNNMLFGIPFRISWW